MKDSISSLDLSYIIKELSFLNGGRIQKVYQDGKSVRLRIYTGSETGNQELYLSPGKIFLTDYKREGPKQPPSFALLLRKYMQNRRIIEIRQRNFDRVIEIVLDDVILIYEMFSTGNAILTDRNYKIIRPLEMQRWKDRKVVPKENYTFPSSNQDPLKMDNQELLNYFKKQQMLVQALAFLGFGGTYSEELCQRVGIKKTLDTTKLSLDDVIKISNEIENIFSEEINPVIIFENDKKKDVTPFKLGIYQGKEIKKFETFNQALDKFFSEEELNETTKTEEKTVSKKKGKVETKLESQKEALKNFIKKEREMRSKAELMEMNYPELERAIFTVQKYIKDKESWSHIKEQMQAMFSAKINEKQSEMEIPFGGKMIKVDFRKSPRENITNHWKKAKSVSKKQEGAKKALEQSKKELDKVSEEKIKQPPIIKKRKKKWFEKFRWFISSEGFLCIGGRDATQNEMVIKKHTDPHDIVFHADIHGSPFVVVKTNGKEVSEKTLNEAATFTASYSSAWKDGRAVDVYYINPDQVSKEAPSGMYVSKGSFMIYGQKNFIKAVKLQLSIGIIHSDEGPVVISGKESAIKEHTKHYMDIMPGSTSPNKIAKTLRLNLINSLEDEEKQKALTIPIEDFQRVLPNGDSDIVKE